jgi:hypothetical protein
MTTTPFFALKLRGKKDAVLARQRARRVASLLSFDPHEQACIAAGTFVIACQALVVFGKSRICFQIEQSQLQIHAQELQATPAEDAALGSKRLSGLFNEYDVKTLFRLCKPLPPQETPADQLDLGWLVTKVEETACKSLFDEIVKQNQETLALLHELRLYQGAAAKKEEKSSPPHAA